MMNKVSYTSLFMKEVIIPSSANIVRLVIFAYMTYKRYELHLKLSEKRVFEPGSSDYQAWVISTRLPADGTLIFLG